MFAISKGADLDLLIQVGHLR